MADEGPLAHVRSAALLRNTRELLRSPWAKLLAVVIGIVYAFISLVAGYMLEFLHEGVSGVTVQVVANPYSAAWWNYPAVIIEAPSGILVLPFLATVTMVLVGSGVGLGMGAGLVLASRVLRERSLARRGMGATGALAGLTPAMVALLTLGACCSTSAAAAAGIGAVAQASGATYDQLVANAWYLNVFQVAVLGIALLAQEQLLSIFPSLVRARSTGADEQPSEISERRLRARRVGPVRGIVRLSLLIAGALWSVSVLLEWSSAPATGSVVGAVIGGLLQRPFVGVTIVLASLMPAELLSVASLPSFRRWIALYRALLLVCGLSLVVGVPPPLPGWGLGGVGNQVLAARGVGPPWGGTGPPVGAGPELLVILATFELLLGTVSIILALLPGGVLAFLEGDPWFDATGGPLEEGPSDRMPAGTEETPIGGAGAPRALLPSSR